jgi:hypothetical protein
VTAVYFDATLDDAARRERVLRGDLFVYAPTASTRALCAFARGLVEATFAPLDPRTAQFSLALAAFHPIVIALNRQIAQHPTAREHVRDVLGALGCEPERTYFNPPLLKNATTDGYSTPRGRAYFYAPHRDTWAAAPPCQVNWWLPLYPIEAENTLAFHPRYWQRAVRNGSAGFDYHERASPGTGPRIARELYRGMARSLAAEEPIEHAAELRLVCEPGGIIMFSGSHLHSTVPNTSGVTRYSLDFRTVHLDDLRERRGPPDLDSASTGTSLVDFYRASDLAPLPGDVIALYDRAAAANAPGAAR